MDRINQLNELTTPEIETYRNPQMVISVFSYSGGGRELKSAIWDTAYINSMGKAEFNSIILSLHCHRKAILKYGNMSVAEFVNHFSHD